MISHLTVTAHLKNIYNKLGMSSRAEAAAYAVNQGWITIEKTSK
jgi:DNA-binding CsgD family transcriptional regulator